jgi:hypothetical protein
MVEEKRNKSRKLPRPMNTLSAKQAAQLLKIKPHSLAKRAYVGTMKVVKVGRLNMYPADDVARIIRLENTSANAGLLLAVLNEMVAANNKAIAEEAANGRRKNPRPQD